MSGEKRKKSALPSFKALLVPLVALISILAYNYSVYPKFLIYLQTLDDPEACPLYPKIVPSTFEKDNSTVLEIIRDPEFRIKSAQKLSGAVQVDTTVGDNQPDVPEAPEIWSNFQLFHDYLEKTFPLIHKHLEVVKVNTYGLVYYWKGSNESLKPLMLMAHQDVVPVQEKTIGDWSHPPFAGHFDGTKLYGRGSFDCKNALIAMMEALELLLEKGFQPQRGVIASFGFDEEASGVVGASNLGKYLEKRFGRDSVYAIIDEGVGLLTDPLTKMIVASPGTGEKGYIDITAELKAPGGHSSVPPDHTTIGIMSRLAASIEDDPFAPELTETHPVMSYLVCLATNAGERMGKMARKTILRARVDKFANALLIKFIQKNKIARYLIQTSQSINIINGGEKANALPEDVKMVVNHRISVDSNVQEVKDRFVKRVVPLAESFDLALEAFGEKLLEGDAEKGTLVIDQYTSLEVAPVTPHNDTVWKYLAGVTRHLFEDVVFPELDYPILTIPSIMPGNTDTKHYWHLSKNIFRYTPGFIKSYKGINLHSVDEALEFDAHLQALAFFYEYIQAIDTPDADNAIITI